MGFKVLQEWSNQKIKKSNHNSIKKDSAYIQTILKDQINTYRKKYLTNPEKSVESVTFEIKQDYVDSLLYLISNTSITDSLEFKQIKPNVFEIKNRSMSLF